MLSYLIHIRHGRALAICASMELVALLAALVAGNSVLLIGAQLAGAATIASLLWIEARVVEVGVGLLALTIVLCLGVPAAGLGLLA